MSKHKPRKGARRPHTSSTTAQYGQAKRIASTAERSKLTALHRQGQFVEAMTLARSILETSSDDAFVWTALGSCLIKLQEYQEALQALEQANSLFPDDPLILDSLIQVHTRLGDHPQAIALQKRSLELEPGNAAGHFHLASLLNECGDAQALEHLEQAEALGHDLTEVLALRGAVQTALFRFNDALASFRKLVELSPDNPEVQNNIANVYKDIGDFAAAEAAYYKALELNPTYAKAYSNLLFTMHYDPERTPGSILALAKDWENRFAPSARLEPIEHSRLLPGKRLRVGLLSGGLRQHPVGQMITVALEHLDDTLELHAYSTTQVQDHITARIRKTVASWQYVGHLGTQQLAERIREDGIDILIDLSGHGAGNRLSSIAMRPAPLAVKWVGCLVGSTGLSAFDYLLSDHIETPAGVEHLYVEKLIRMPDDYICYLPSENMPPITMLPASINGYVTLGCFNNPAKINPTLLAEWATLMHQLPDCRLLLKGAQYDSPEFCERIRDIMRQHGIADERLILEGPANHRALLETYNRVDIALDPWPYSGGLTTCEAMLMGVPVVTFPGPTFAGRHSATHLVNAGLPELVVDSWDEYRQRVIELANDLPNLSVIRACLRRVLMESPVCDGARFARHFTTAMRAIWQRHCQGKVPAALSLEKDGTARFEDDEQPVKLLPLTEPVNESTTAAPEFSWNIEGQIITLDNGAVLARDPAFPALQKLGTFATITFDPSSSLKNAEQLQINGELHHYPHVTLGNGEESTLYACLDPAMTGTLEPLPADQQLPNHQQGTQVLARLPITTLRLDDIEGLESIDWLLLDNMNDSLTILENGEKALTNTLLVQVRVNFAPTHKNQPELTQISHWLSRHGFSFYRFSGLEHYSHLPARKDLLKTQATQLMTADALFIPSHEKIESLSESQRAKLAFILHSVYSAHDISSRLLDGLSGGASEKYLESAAYIAPKENIPKKQSSDTERRVPGPPEILSDDASRIYKESRAHELKPEVSIICLSYNHEKFIEDAIKGFIGQRTNFIFEVIIHDDASTDGTQEIIKKYQKEYPGMITTIIQEENQYSQKKSIFNPALKAARGKYIALCEGDDYWTDPDKLQKQYEFMEKNSDYSVCYHNSLIFKDNSIVSYSKLPENMKRDFSAKDLLLNNCFILTLSMFFRKCFTEMPKEISGVVNGDNFIISMLGLYGKGKYIESISPAAYRLHGSSIWSSISSEKKNEALAHTFSKLAEYHKREKRIVEFRIYREKSDHLLKNKTRR